MNCERALHATRILCPARSFSDAERVASEPNCSVATLRSRTCFPAIRTDQLSQDERALSRKHLTEAQTQLILQRLEFTIAGDVFPIGQAARFLLHRDNPIGEVGKFRAL